MNFIQRALGALCILLLCGCSKTVCRQWEIQETLTKTPFFNAARIILPPDTNYTHLEMEFVRNRSGIRCYLNLLLMQAPPLKGNACLTRVEVTFEDREPCEIFPYLLAGGQKLLLPGDAADFLIQELLQEHPFQLKIGRSKISVIIDNFAAVYEKLLALPIDEISKNDCENLSFEP